MGIRGVDWGGAALLAALYGLYLGAGYWAAKRRRRADDARTQTDADDDAGSPVRLLAEFLVAGRAMPMWIAMITMAATWIDGGYLLGTVEYTFKYGIAYGVQGGVCFGLSLVVGGFLFAGRMRALEFSTMVDPFAARYGPRWAAVLSIPAVLGELFWSGALLVALGATLSLLLHVDVNTAIGISAFVVVGYTWAGGMWSVAYTDVVQFLWIPVGLLASLPFVMGPLGGMTEAWSTFAAGKGDAARIMPTWGPGDTASSVWTWPSIVAWWDMTVMLIFGGMPWNCYFQRVLSCATPKKARWHSYGAGAVTILLTIPPAMLGVAAYAYWGDDPPLPTSALLPRLFWDHTPYPIMLLGLAAIVGAVTSSFSSSILSGGAMLGWNVYRPLFAPADIRVDRLRAVIRAAILILGAIAVLLAWMVKSVAALWLFTGDLVFVLLFPQLFWALYDPRANRTGSCVAFFTALILRLGAGVSLETDAGILGFPAFLPYAEWTRAWLPGSGDIATWYDPNGATFWPARTFAALCGFTLLPIVSRLTSRWDPPRPLPLPKTAISPNPQAQIASE